MGIFLLGFVENESQQIPARGCYLAGASARTLVNSVQNGVAVA